MVNPLPIDYQIRTKAEWFRPAQQDLSHLAEQNTNTAIAQACGATETTVRNWLAKAEVRHDIKPHRRDRQIPAKQIAKIRNRAERTLTYPARRTHWRLTKERVGRIISMIGEKASNIVEHADEGTGQRVKHASAHDLRRDCALRLVNAGVSAETLKLVLRHKSFSTTERFYGATRAAQSAAAEINEKLDGPRTKSELMGGTEEAPQLSAEELGKLKALLDSL